MQTAPLTFRLHQSVKFNRPVNKDKDTVSPGGYEIRVKDIDGSIKSISFDFEDYEGEIDKNDATIVHCMQKNPDYACFKELNILNEYMLRHIVSVTEWFIFTGELDDVKENETPLIPVEIQEPMFEIIPQNGDTIQIPVTVTITPESNFADK